MKKLFPEAPDVPQNVANRASKIVEKYLKMHRVSRACELPEEAKVRLYRDLRFFFESGGQSPKQGQGGSFSLRQFLANLWEKFENFMSMSQEHRGCERLAVIAWAPYGDSARLAIIPWANGLSAYDESG